MKVIAQNPQKLRLRAFSWPLFLAITVLVVLFPAALLYALYVGDILSVLVFLAHCILLWVIAPDHIIDHVDLVLERSEQTITIVRRTIFKIETTTFELGSLIEANIWSATSPRAMLWYAISYGNPIPELVLVFATEDPPKIYRVPGARGSESNIIGIANTINAWLSIDVDSHARQA